jgi:hypothetical protein
MKSKSSKKQSSRSKCVVCGRIRFQDFLQEQRCLNGSLVWVCSSSLEANYDYVSLGDYFVTLHPCIMSFFTQQKKELLLHQENFDASLKNLWFYNKLSTLKNVAPEVTFLLQ